MLGLAVLGSHTELFLDLLSSGLPIYSEGCTPLLLTACYCGNFQIIEVLGARIDHAFHEAVRLRNGPFATFLLGYITSALLSGQLGQSIFAAAIHNDMIDLVQQLFLVEGTRLKDTKTVTQIPSAEMLDVLVQLGLLPAILSTTGSDVFTAAIESLAHPGHGQELVETLLSFPPVTKKRFGNKIDMRYCQCRRLCRFEKSYPLVLAAQKRDTNLLRVLLDGAINNSKIRSHQLKTKYDSDNAYRYAFLTGCPLYFPNSTGAKIDWAFYELTRVDNALLFADARYVDFVTRLPVVLTFRKHNGEV
ncbi:hypothetical protein QBC44DRAFT_302919 [Cladorrhinum sp. PSN332]|nr:hypothetical protein QBC44DRAFT_302919 [Cladorrhinum sp. PSN332]